MKPLLKKILGVVLCLPAIALVIIMIIGVGMEACDKLNSWREIKILLQVGFWMGLFVGITFLGINLIFGDNQ